MSDMIQFSESELESLRVYVESIKPMVLAPKLDSTASLQPLEPEWPIDGNGAVLSKYHCFDSLNHLDDAASQSPK